MSIKYWHWLCTTICVVVILCLLIAFCRSCYYEHKPESILYGNWEKLDSDDGYNDHTLTFDRDGKYYNSNTGIEVWNYKFVEPDSLILYHHGLYEERYKILKLTEDTLTIRCSECIFHAVDNGNEIEAPYGDGSKPIYTYLRLNHSTTTE